jgi:DNA-binding NtrC family response regulator
VSDPGSGSLHVRGSAIHNILVIADKHEVGPCLEGVLRDRGYSVTTEDSFVSAGNGRGDFDLVIATNTTLSSRQIQTTIPEIKSHHPKARILLLSGYFDPDWMADLRTKGMDAYLELPFERDVLLQGVAGLLTGPAS